MIFYADSNVVTDVRAMERLALALEPSAHTIRVPALVLAECLFRWRRRWRSSVPFDEALAVEDRIQKYAPWIEVEALDIPVAQRLGRLLAERFPTEDAWKEAKWAACRPGQRLTNRRVSGHIDYYVAVPTQESPVITLDVGAEWDGLPSGSVLSLEAALGRIAGAP